MGDGGAGGVEAATNGREGPGVVSRRTNLEALLHHFWDVKMIEGAVLARAWNHPVTLHPQPVIVSVIRGLLEETRIIPPRRHPITG